MPYKSVMLSPPLLFRISFESTSIKMHNIDNRFVIGPETILSAGKKIKNSLWGHQWSFAFRWAAVLGHFNVSLIVEGNVTGLTLSIIHNFWRRRRDETESNLGASDLSPYRWANPASVEHTNTSHPPPHPRDQPCVMESVRSRKEREKQTNKNKNVFVWALRGSVRALCDVGGRCLYAIHGDGRTGFLRQNG